MHQYILINGLLQMMGNFFLKASTYQMIVENSKKTDSYFYSVEHPMSKKSMFNVLFFNKKPAYTEPGVCHGDELPFLFDARIPLATCDVQQVISESFTYSTVSQISKFGEHPDTVNCTGASSIFPSATMEKV